MAAHHSARLSGALQRTAQVKLDRVVDRQYHLVALSAVKSG